MCLFIMGDKLHRQVDAIVFSTESDTGIHKHSVSLKNINNIQKRIRDYGTHNPDYKVY